MMKDDVILKVENLSKQYRLGLVGTGTISHDLNRFLARIRGKEDPYLKIGESNDRSTKGTSEYVWALKDINFEVKRGEILGIIGKNGAGKSTLLKILSKVTGPTTGAIKSKGRIASLLEVGTGFHPEMTGKENIFLNGAILGMTKKEIASKLDEIIEFSGCERYVETPVKRYSSGMKVRLAFAVAAFLEPDILVVDEVLAVGDAEFQKKAIGKMQDISSEGGRTVLFVSHNMAAVKNLCSKVIILNDGRLTFNGATDDGILEYGQSKEKKYTFSRSEQNFDKLKNIEIRNIFFSDTNGTPSQMICSGQDILLNIKILCKNKINDAEIGVGFYSKEDNPMFHCSTKVLGKTITLEGDDLIQLIIPKWPLPSMLLYVNLYVRSKENLLIHIKETIWLNSEQGDYYNTGKLPSWTKGFYIDYDWKK
jgi:lipopolysaccharide transport system ATP-binding protein